MLVWWQKVLLKHIKNEVKEQKAGFLGMLDATVSASLLGNILAGKWIVVRGDHEVIPADDRVIRAAKKQNF